MIRILILALLSTLPLKALATEQLFTQQPSMMPSLANSGEYQVGVQTIKITNPDQLSSKDFSSRENRDLNLEVWYPSTPEKKAMPATYEGVTRLHIPFSLQGEAYRDSQPIEGGRFPIVVLSHGYTGYRTIMFYLGEHLASHGYIVVGIDHTDSTTGEVDFKNSPFSGFPSTLINRAKDQQFVLDHFTDTDHFLSKLVDTDNAVVIGYSMGGYGAINTVGGCYAHSSAGLQRLGFPEQAAAALLPVFNFCNAGKEKVDTRWKAMVSFAPWGQELNLHSAESLAKIDVATLYVTGDHDDVSGYEHGVKKLFEQTGSAHNYLLVYENARHNIAPHPAPQVAYASDDDIGHYIEPAWSNEALTRINEHMTLAFLDCHVKQIDEKCAFLPKRELSNQIKQADGKLTEAWPGFPNRWGMGTRFIRSKGEN